METIRHVTLGCCVISTIAGMIRVFWPKNGFSAVINAVLVLYIVTAGLQMLRGADWKQLTAELYHMPAAAEKYVPDYTEYSRRLGREVSEAAVREALQNAGIDCVVQLADSGFQVELVHAGDRARVQAVLAAICGQTPYKIITGGEAP